MTSSLRAEVDVVHGLPSRAVDVAAHAIERQHVLADAGAREGMVRQELHAGRHIPPSLLG